MKNRTKVLLVELLDLGLSGVVLLCYDLGLPFISVKITLTVAYLLQWVCLAAWLGFVDDKIDKVDRPPT